MMNQRNYRVNLLFNADTTLALQNIQQLGTLLNTLTTKTPIGFETGSIKSAISDVQQLQIHLQNAVNTNTGKLDLSKFNSSLKMSKTSLSQYSASLLSLGPTGQQAFARLATAISQAEVPMYRLSAKTREFMTTLGNTAKWQIASTAIHGVTGALSESIRYIEKFDKALTDIKIVSDINDKALLDFSKRTREIAKDVNSTALEIAQGSAIYFQQGLAEDQVAERIAVTAKMANITGETTEKVSSQLTAIWNNFDDGTKTLESYADALAYLGARTAADTNQIATATEKFAASAKVVGLSYEYASTAVAEVIDRTQMAPEEVGTAFKTILSRMQGLKLGETLEDGVELNKYAEALDVVGVKVLDANGGLIEADAILKDLGAKWDGLDAAQKKALATTVAGVRQQTQFMALMEEWDDIEASVADLTNSTGYLTEANNEYADSVAGVKKQFENVKSEFFKKLFGDDYANNFIKSFYHSMIDLIEQVDRFIDAFGGLKPMLITFGMLFAKNLMPSVLNFTRNSMANLATLFGFTEAKTKKLQSEFAKITQQNLSGGMIDPAMEKQLTIAQELISAKQRLQNAVKYQGQFEKDIVNYQIQQFEQASSVLQQELERQHSLEKQVQLQKDLLVSQSRNELGTTAAVNAYRESSTKPVEYQNEVVDIATTSTVADIDKQITTVRANASQPTDAMVEKQGQREDLITQEAAVRRSLAINQKAAQGPTNTEVQRVAVSNAEAKAAQDAAELKRIKEEIAQIDKEIADLGERNTQNVDEEIAKLEEAKKLRQDIQNSKREFDSSTVVSKEEMYLGGLSEQEGGQEVRQFSNEIVKDSLSKGSVTTSFNQSTGETDMTLETSINNVEKLIMKRAELTNTTQKTSSMEKDLASTMKQVSKAVADFNKTGKTNTKTLDNAKKQAKAYAKELNSMIKALTKGKQGKKILSDLGKAMKQITKATDMKQVEQGYEGMLKVLQKVKNGAKDAGITVDNAVDQMLISLKQSGASAQSLDILEAQLKELGLWSQDTANKFAKLRGELQTTSASTMNFGAMMGNAIGKVGSFAGSLQMAISGVQMLKSAFTEANSPMEALMNYLMGLSMILPMVAAAFNLLGAAKKKDTKASLENAVATEIDTGSQKKNLIQTAWAAAAKAWKGAVDAFGVWGAAIGAVLAAAILVALIGGGIAAAMSGANAQKKEEKDKKEEEQTEATVKGLADQLSNAKQKADELKSSFDDYNSIADKLANCKKGTQEWTEALIENNEKVSDLLDKYPELAKYVSMGEDGELVISEEGQQHMLQQASQKVAEARTAKYLYDNKQQQKDIKTLQNKTSVIKSWTEVEEMGQSAFLSNIHGDWPQRITKFSGTVSQETKDEANKLIAKYGLNDAASHLNGLSEGLGEQVKNLISNEQKLADAIEKNTAATLANTQTIGAEAMTGNEEYEKSVYKENIAAIAGTEIISGKNANYDSILADISARTKDENDDVRWNESRNKDIWNEYMKTAFGEDVQWRNTDFIEGGMTAEVYNAETFEWEKKEFTDELVASTVAGKRNVEGSADFNNQMAKQINTFTNENQADIFTAAVTGNNSFLSPELLTKSEEELQKIIDSMEISKETLKEMNYNVGDTPESLEKARKEFKAYQKEIINSEKAFKDLKKEATGALGMIKKEAEENAEEITKGNYEWSEEAKEHAKAVSASLSKALGAESDLGLDPSFISENMGIIEDFMNGVEGAGERLKTQLRNDAIIDVTANIKDDQMKAQLQNIHNNLIAFENKDWKVGIAIDPVAEQDFYAACQNIVDAAGMTEAQATEYFGKMGYDVKFKKEKKKVTEIVWNKKYSNKYDQFNNLESTTVTATPKTIVSEVEVPVIETITPNASFGGHISNIGGSSGATPRSTGGNTGGSNGGGGDSSPAEKNRLTKKSEIVERYKEHEDNLKTINNLMDKTAEDMDKLWGGSRLKAMDEYNNHLRQSLKYQQLYQKDIKYNLELDKKAIQDFMQEAANGKLGGLGDLGLSFIFDETTGNIINYTEIMTILHSKLNELEQAKNALSTSDAQKDYDDQTLGPFQDKISYLQDLISQYDETKELVIEKDKEYRDSLNEIRQNTIDQINYTIEIATSFNENSLEIIEYKLSKIEDDFYKIAEASKLTSDKINNQLVNLELAYKPYNDLLWDYNNTNNGVLFEDVAQAAMDAIPNMLEALESIKETDKEMLEYYGQALEMAQEKFDKYSQFFDSATSKMEYYRSMLSLIGKEMDYEKTGIILRAQQNIAKNTVQANKSYYETLKNDYQALYNRWLAEKDSLDGYEKEMLEKKLYDAKVAVSEAEEEYLSSLETTGELAQEILQNNLSKAQKILEENLVGSSLEDYMIELDRLSRKQEEYLTTTNKMYETNKLIRQAQLDMDKTDNNRAKQQYNNYVKYIEQLQESGQLSSYELSIAQAKYELLQAQIALEEAQDAKSQVRLTRDAEGNYGYVYTANENKVSEAEQALADAENALYNIGLEGAQDYQSKYAETLQEAVETFSAINEQYQTGQIASEEEYNKKMSEAKNYYYDLLKQYNELYYTSHDILVKESYLNEEDYLLQGIGNLEDFKDYSEEYLDSTNQAFTEYNNNVADITTIVDDNLKTIKDGTNEVMLESDNLVKEIENKLIPAMRDELETIRGVTSVYAAQRDELEKTIKKYEKYIEKLQTVAQYGVYGGHDYANIADFSKEIEKYIDAGFEVDDPIVQKLLEARWNKMAANGGDNYNYLQMMEEYVANGGNKGDAWYTTLKALREYKILKTDWAAYKKENPNAAWVDDIRAEKLNHDFEAEINEYLKRAGTSESDTYVQDRRALQRIKEAELNKQSEDTEQKIDTEIIKEETDTTKENTEAVKDLTLTAEKLAELAKAIWRGDYGNGQARIDALKNLGYTDEQIKEIQKAVDRSAPVTSEPVNPEPVTTEPKEQTTTSPYSFDDQLVDQYSIGKQQFTPQPLSVEDWIQRFENSTRPQYTILKPGDPGYDWVYNSIVNRIGVYDTGGYTGSWGPEGKLAMLHEKELILNKQDTENFLTATNILREINQMLDNNALIASLGMINLKAMTINSPADQVLQQDVTIHADFPNVTDHNEIEIAIDNLINAASQHAYKV